MGGAGPTWAEKTMREGEPTATRVEEPFVTTFFYKLGMRVSR